MAQRERRAQRSLDALMAIGRSLTTTAPYEQVVAGMMATVSDVLGVEKCGFFLHDPERDELVLQRPGFDADEEVAAFFQIPLSRPGPTRQVFFSRRPAVVNDALDPASPWFQGARVINSRTLLIVPLVIEGRGVGVLSLNNKRTGAFGKEDVELITLLAPHLALAIDAAAKHQKLQQQQRQLDRALQVHAELSRVIASAPDLGPLAESLARLIRRTVVLVDTDMRVLAWADSGAAGLERPRVEAALTHGLAAVLPDLPGTASMRANGEATSSLQRVDFVVAAIRAGDQVDGYVAVVETCTPLDVVEIRAVEHAATLFAFQFLRVRTAREVERRIRGELFQELVSAVHISERGAAALLEQLGASASGPWRVARLELVTDGTTATANGFAFDPRVVGAVTTAWNQTGAGTPLAPWRSGFASVVPDRQHPSSGTPSDEVTRVAAAINQALAVAASQLHCVFALGSRVCTPRDLGRSLEQANDALGLAQRLGLLDRPVLYEEVGIERVLLDSMDTSTSHTAFVQEVLGPLLDYDSTNHRDLLATLRAYVAADYTTRPAAEQLFIHVNTLRFRLRRIGELLGGNWPDGPVRFRVELAVRLLDLQELRARQHPRPRLAAPLNA
jgi:putative methionine-R-sulfoxide reductase with GAF domain